MLHPIDTFKENLVEVARLVDIHIDQTGRKQGRRYKVEILNKSAVVLVTACWESFVEDAATAATDYILANIPEWDKLPKSIKKGASLLLKNDQNDLSCWKMADSGWKSVVLNYRDSLLHKYLFSFHNPSAANVDCLYEDLLGIKDISASWHWKGMHHDKAKQKLSDYIKLRGSIAHRVRTATPIYKEDVMDYIHFAGKLAVRTGNTLRKHVHTSIGSYPWVSYSYGTVK